MAVKFKDVPVGTVLVSNDSRDEGKTIKVLGHIYEPAWSIAYHTGKRKARVLLTRIYPFGTKAHRGYNIGSQAGAKAEPRASASRR